MDHRNLLYVLFSGLIGALLGILVIIHIVTGSCRSQNWFTAGGATYICKQIKPF